MVISTGGITSMLHIRSNDHSNLQILSKDIQKVPNSPSQTSVQFTVVGKASGIYNLDYATDDRFSNKIGQTIVMIEDRNSPPPVSDVITNAGIFKKLCQETSVGSLNNLKIRSNLKFDGTKSYGVVSLIVKDNSILPLSVSGGDFNSGGFQTYPLTEPLFEYVTAQVINNEDKNCLTGVHPSIYMNQILSKYNGPFGLTFLQTFNSNLPSWVNVVMSNSTSPGNVFRYKDISAVINTGKYFLDKPASCLAGFPFQPEAMYYVYQPGFNLNLFFPSQLMKIPKRRCFIVDLASSTYFVGAKFSNLPLLNENLLSYFKISANSLNFIGFKKESEQFTITEIGDVSLNFGEESLSVYLQLNMTGQFEQNFSTTSSIFDKSFNHVFSARTIETSVLLKVKTLGDTQRIEMKGLFDELTIKESEESCQSGRSLTGTFTPFSIKAPSILTQLFQLDIGQPTSIHVVESNNQSKITVAPNKVYSNEILIIQDSIEKLVKDIDALKPLLTGELSSESDEVKSHAEKSISNIKVFLAPTFASKSPREFTSQTTLIRNDLLELNQRIFIFSINYKSKRKLELSGAFKHNFLSNFSRIMHYSIKRETAPQSIKLLKMTGKGRICTSKQQCIFDGDLSFISGTEINRCSPDSIIKTLASGAIVVIFKIPKDLLVSNMFKVSKGDLFQLDLPARGYDDHYYTFQANWMFIEKDFVSNVTMSYFDQFQTTSYISVFGESVAVHSSSKHPSEVKFSGKLNVINGMASKKIIAKFHQLVANEKKRFSEKSSKLDDELKSMEEVLSRHNLQKSQENSVLDKVKADMTSLSNDITKQTLIVDKKRDQVRQSLDGYTLKNSFMQKCAQRPNYCQMHCTSHIDPGACTGQTNRMIYELTRNCASETISSLQVLKSQKFTNFPIRYIGVSPKVDCTNKCPKLFTKTEPISSVMRNIKSYGHCYRFCNEINTPVVKHKDVLRQTRIEKTVSRTARVCSNVLRQLAAKSDEPYGQEKQLCFTKAHCMFSISPECITNVDDCDKSISDLSSSNGPFKTSFEEFRKEINLLEILKLEKQALQKKLTAQNNLVSFINNLIGDATTYVSDLHDLIKHATNSWSNNILSKYTDSGTLIITELSFDVTQEVGSYSLHYLPLKIKTNDSSTGDILIPVEVTFDATNPDLSLLNAAQSLMDMIKHSEEVPICFNIEASAVYLNNFIMTLEGLIKSYQRSELQHSTDLLDVNRTNNQLFAQVEKLQAPEQNILELQRYQKTINEMFVAYPTWNSTMTNYLSNLQSHSHEQKGCFSFKDCIHYHVDNIKTHLTFHNTSASKAFDDLENILIKLIHYDLTFAQTKDLVNSAKINMINHDPVKYFCGNAPVLRNQITGQMLVNEGDDLVITLEIVNRVSFVTVTWKKDGQIIGDNHLTEYKKKAGIADEGWYTCKLRNRFGETDCGLVKVTVIARPIFHPSPAKLVVYEKSPDRYSYLVCNVSNDERVFWLYQPFQDSSRITRLPGNQYWMDVIYTMSFKNGYYWCEASNNNGVIVTGPKIAYSRQSARIGIEQVPVALSFVVKESRKRKSNDGSSRSRRQIPTTITSTDMDRLRLIISNSLGLTNTDEVLNLKYTKESNEKAKVTFTLNGKDFNAELAGLSSWDDLTESTIEDRKRLLKTIAQMEGKVTVFSLRNGQTLEVLPNGVEVSSSKSFCQDGFGLLENGMVCGKILS